MLAALVVAGCQDRTGPRAGRLLADDGAYPVRLPDGRLSWLYGDALVRRRDGRDQLVHNAAVVEATGKDGAPRSTRAPRTTRPTWSRRWPADGHLAGRRVRRATRPSAGSC
jgi:hypothetical protein